MTEILNASVPSEPGRLSEVAVRNRNLVERTSYKLFGYDFVNYRSDCEQSNVHGLIKYHDVVNYGRRMSDANIHNCVMCGEFDVVIPTQNKDVCKSCDSAFWYNSVLDCAFKFCKGCKNFVTIEMFSDKPDASKCCRCRRRGRDNYLNKKYNVTPQHGTLLLNAFQNEVFQATASVSPTGSQSPTDPQLPCSDEEEPTSAATTTPAHTSIFHTITPYSTSSMEESGSQYSSGLTSLGQAANGTFDKAAPTSALKGPYKKRALSVDYTAPSATDSAQAFYTGAPAKPPKTPRSVSYSNDLHSSGTPSAASVHSSQVTSMGTLDTPNGKNLFTVTPGSELSVSSERATGSVVRFARSHSASSIERLNTPSSLHSAASPASAAAEQDTSGYLWDRACFQSSPAALPPQPVTGRPRAPAYPAVNCAIAITRQNSDSSHITHLSTYAERLSTSGASYYGAKAVSTVRFADLVAIGHHEHSRQGGVDKENQRNALMVDTAAPQQPSATASEMMSLLHSSCKGLFGDEGAKIDTTTAALARESVAVVTPTMQGPASLQCDATLPYTPRAQEESSSSQRSSPRGEAQYGSAEEKSHTEVKCEPAPTPAPVRQQWEWDPSQNPLMHLAMITEHI